MNIIVNGGTKGIGREIVSKLASDNSNKLIVTGRTIELINEISALYPNVSGISIDMSEFDFHAIKYLNHITSEFESVDVLINVAGMLVNIDFIDFPNYEARKIMETNFFGPASAIRLVKPLMKAGSHIINISSMGGYPGSSKYKGLSYYSSSKAALACLTECLAEEFKKSGVRVNCLALGSVQTEMLEKAFPGYKAPVTADEMANFISWFALYGQKVFNGKVLPVALSNP
ncbi:MAG TPA: SDR family oxidoreductase [Bacteroidales bacterium]|nr:SDR family oxidoreductase [Bacteroidales bacterium]